MSRDPSDALFPLRHFFNRASIILCISSRCIPNIDIMDKEQPVQADKAALVRRDDVSDFIFAESKVDGKQVDLDSADVKSPAPVLECDTVTIGEALEASALSAGNKPVDQSDAAAIQAAEARACGTDGIKPGGIAAEAQSAANQNTRTERDEDKTKIADVLTDASEKMGKDKPVTEGDAKGVIGAEMRNNPSLATFPDGVAETMAAAAGLNQY